MPPVANLGGGFDTLGVAVQLYLRAADRRRPRRRRRQADGRRRARRRCRGRNAVERAFDAMAAAPGSGRRPSFVEVESDIPMAAGLGSSAAATVAGSADVRAGDAAAADDGVLLARGDGARGARGQRGAGAAWRPEVGGRATRARDPVALRWTWPDELRLVVATPASGWRRQRRARRCPTRCRAQDAMFNLQRVLVAGARAADQGLRAAARGGERPLASAGARVAGAAAVGKCWRSRIPTCSGAFLSGAGRRWPCSRGATSSGSSSCSRRCTQRAGVQATVRTLAVHQRAARSHARSRLRMGERMKFVAGLTCHLCGATYPPKALWVCSECLGPLEVLVRLRRGARR